VMDISQQLNQEEDDEHHDEDGQPTASFASAHPIRKRNRAERITELEMKLRASESRMRQLEQALESERARTAMFETRLARIEVVFNPRLLRTNETTLASLQPKNVMANGAALNPAS
jgi:chromosome segregation ATPase